MFANKYIQNEKYIFKIQPQTIYEYELGYETSISMDGMEIAREMTHKYILCQLNYALIFVKVPYNANIVEGDSLIGVFVPFSEEVVQDIKKSFSEVGTIDGLLG